MLGRSLIGKFGASAMAAAMAFGMLSTAMSGNVAFAEENVTEEVTEVVAEDSQAVPEIETEVNAEVKAELNVEADEEERVTVSGNIIGYEYDKPFEVEFDSWGYRDDDGNYMDSVTITVAKDGHYSVELLKDCSYILYLPGADGYCLEDWENDGIFVHTFDEDREFDIKIQMLNYGIEGYIEEPDIFDIVEADYDEFYDVCSGCVISFAGDDFYHEEVLSDDYISGFDLPIGEYIVTLKGKTGNVYSVMPLSMHWRNHGYVDWIEIGEPYSYVTSLYYGDYRTRDNEARIACNFENSEDLDLSDTKFYFVDSNNNHTNACSYLELKYGTIRLPKDKTYKLVAEGLPKGYVIDYSKMNEIHPTQKDCGDGRYDYDVVISEGSAFVPLAITKDTEDIVASEAGKKYTFAIEAEGTELSYSWYMKKPGASKFSKAGIYENEFSLYAKTNNDGIQVYCVVKDGKGNKLVGRTATFTVTNPDPVITYPNGKEISAAAGKKANFRISAKSDLELTYCWYYMVPKTNGGDGKFHKAGCYTDTYTRSAGKKIDGMQAYCLVTDSNGKKVKSDAITFTLK